MKERPILFSGPMVRALLEGRKTQTRRMVKPQPTQMTNGEVAWPEGRAGGVLHRPPAPQLWVDTNCPYGQPGDRLWVREAWRPFWDGVDEPGQLGDCIQYRADGAKIKPEVPDVETGYRFDNMCDAEDPDPRWRPSIHMPRWACRIVLEVTAVRVERVRDIAPGDALAEGIQSFTKDGTLLKFWPCDPAEGPMKRAWQDLPTSPREAFFDLFYGINKRAPRDQNPWVWVVEFRRLP